MNERLKIFSGYSLYIHDCITGETWQLVSQRLERVSEHVYIRCMYDLDLGEARACLIDPDGRAVEELSESSNHPWMQSMIQAITEAYKEARGEDYDREVQASAG